MILPFEQHSIAFEDITYSVDMPKVMNQNQTILLLGKTKLQISSQ